MDHPKVQQNLLRIRTNTTYQQINSTTVICVTNAASGFSALDVPQSLLIGWQYWSDVMVLEGFDFTYKANPLVYSLSPVQTILSGGTKITVSGTHLDHVHHPKMKITTIVGMRSSEVEHYSFCDVNLDGNEMHCVMPAIDIDKDVIVPSALCKEKSDPDSSECLEDVGLYVGLYLDGIEQYQHHSRMYPYQDPQVYDLDAAGVVQTWWPNYPTDITIKGRALSYGSLNSQYTVQIGGAPCDTVEVRSDVIICTPPQQQPEIIDGETRHYVNVSLGNWHRSPGYVTYETSILQCVRCTLALLIGLFVVLMFFTVVVVVVVLRRRSSSQLANLEYSRYLTTMAARRPRAHLPLPNSSTLASYYEDPVNYMYTSKSPKTNRREIYTAEANMYTSQQTLYKPGEDEGGSVYMELQRCTTEEPPPPTEEQTL